MTILLIGGGLIGAHIAGECHARGEKAVVLGYHLDRVYLRKVGGIFDEQWIDMAIRKSSDLIDVLNDFRIRKLVVAAGSLRSAFGKHSGVAIVNESQLMLAVYAAALSYRLEKLIYISSLGVYGASQMKIEEHLPVPVSAYGITKLYNEQIIQAVTNQARMPTLIIRPAGIIGPNPKRSGNWMSSEINRAFQSKSEPVLISNQLSSPCDYLDVRDLARFIVDRLAADDMPSINESDIINIGSGKMVNGEELLRNLREALGKEVFFSPDEKEIIRGTDFTPLPITKAIDHYGYTPLMDLAKSIAYMGEFYAC